MAEDPFLKGLVKKALGGAAGAAGGAVGGAVGKLVLDFFGLHQTDLSDVLAALVEIENRLSTIDAKIDKLGDRFEWDKQTQKFSDVASAITVYSTDVGNILKGYPTQAARDAAISTYFTKTANLSALEINLVSMHKSILGTTDGLSLMPSATLVTAFIDLHWKDVRGKSFAEAHKALMDVFVRAANLQRIGASMLVTYFNATGQAALADVKPAECEDRLALQLQATQLSMPGLIAMSDVSGPRRSILVREPKIWDGTAMESGTSNPDWTAIGMVRPTMDGGQPPDPMAVHGVLAAVAAADGTGLAFEPSAKGTDVYSIGAAYDIVLVDDGKSRSEAAGTLALERWRTDFPDNSPSFGSVMLDVCAVGPRTGGTAIEATIETTDRADVYRITDAAGRVFVRNTHETIYAYGLLLHQQDTSLDPEMQFLLRDVVRLPDPPSGRVDAWSRAFANKPSGEGRFGKGFRVRYRLVGLNRFGESAPGPWIEAKAYRQDANGYFDGNDTYYFPQIAIAVDPTGRLEAVRVLRQFLHGAEEDVTAGGTLTGTPALQEKAIFDDFTP